MNGFREIDPFHPAALSCGFIVGVLVPRKSRAEYIASSC